ncbi:MAG: Piwi domain-containing protein, partial [archaeon]
LYVITTYPYDFNLKLYGLTEPYLEKEEINDIQSLDNYKVLVEDMLKYFIDDNLKEMGYVLKESQKEKYLNFDKLEFIESSPVNFRKYDGFSLEVDLLSFREDEVSFLLWMDYSSTIVLSLFDYYNHLLESDKEVDKINRLKVKKFPEDHTLSIDSIGKEENLETKNKEYPDKSYLDYYHDKYGWSLDNKVQPFVKCTYDNIDNTKHFPIETLFIHRKSYSEVLNTDYEAELDLSPDERMRFFINLMKDLKKDMAGKSPHIEINDYPLTWGELENLDICKSGFKIRRPYVSFSKENQITSKDTRDIYNHGPYIGEKEIKISFILKPYKLDKDIVIESLSHICHSYNTSNFGTISFDKNHIFNYDPKADENTLREIIGDIEVTEKQKKRNAGVVILNKSPDDNYHIFKEIITQEHDIPTQMFTQKIIKEISNEEGSGRSKKSFLQIFNSTLKENESTWVLKNPADDENETMYVGLGYSYKPHEYENRASTFVSMCDAHGRNLSWKPMDIVVQKDRYITEKAFSKMAHRVYGKISEHENIGRIVFYRKGDLYENEINAMKNEIGDGFREIDSVDFLTIIQNPIARVFQKDDRGYYNPEKGLVFKFNGNKLLLLNSTISIRDKRETSMQPIILEKKLGDSKILDLGKEYFDISYLNWNDPIKLSKECLVLKLANKMAKMMKDLRTREPLKYFVL